ncbi:RNA polymerase sigma-70 factor [Pedobacter yulinensis]|uniref:RNA polymerase sigma-70 factor n=1 Tax=Pedobacter yulinensis TaxID=2126353 RepID=A0A2T3HJ97_9SPHI|nr:RNA polymerase sigma-70 factor [Pedobacter yulinensis]PST82510.1 RNA polymerase sigma-70 factor [Pedobacter yulinensis]
MTVHEETLILHISSGDEEAFRVLFGRYRDKIFNYVLKLTKSREASEEIVMDVFLKLWQGRALLHELDNFPAFVSTIARNKALDFLRLAAKDRVLRDLVWEEIELAATQRADEPLLTAELQKEIDEAVDQLSPQRRTIFRLSRDEHMTYDQIAAHLNLSKATIKNHMLDALKILRLHLSRNARLFLLVAILTGK